MSKRTNTVKITPAICQRVGESKNTTVLASDVKGHTIRSICAASGLSYTNNRHKLAVTGLVKYLVLTGAVTNLGRRHNVVKGRSLRGRPEEVYTFNSLDVLTQFANLPVPEAQLTTKVARKPRTVKAAMVRGAAGTVLPAKTLYTKRELVAKLSIASFNRAINTGKLVKDGFGWYRNNGAF